MFTSMTEMQGPLRTHFYMDLVSWLTVCALSTDWVGALWFSPHSSHVAMPSSLFLKLPIFKMYLTLVVVVTNK